MSSFYDKLDNQVNQRKTLTENGAIAYATSGKELLDFNFDITSFRKAEVKEIQSRFAKVYYEDPMVAVKYLFYLGDIREGIGERKAFNACIDWLVENHPEIVDAVACLIPFYTRWDYLIRLADSKLSNRVVDIIKQQILDDADRMNANEETSLLAKWMPSSNTSSKKTRELAESLRKKLGFTPKQYRQVLSKMRAYLKIVESQMSANEWDKIEYSHVPSKANILYANAFMRHDEERRSKYLEALKEGKTKINAGVLQPHEIVHNYTDRHYWDYDLKEYDETLEQLWKALPKMTMDDVLVVRDGSGSMMSAVSGNTSALDVATALAIYMADHNSPAWRDKFITFSSRPKIVDLSNCKSLRDKLDLSYKEAECSNTDIEATMMLILDTAINNNIKPEEMPKLIVICSDMQFDCATCRGGIQKSLFDIIALKYEFYGYKMPKICFWNIAGKMNGTIPMQENELGLILCSGFSVQIMKMFMSADLDPYKILLEQINSDRYRPIEDVVKDFI